MFHFISSHLLPKARYHSQTSLPSGISTYWYTGVWVYIHVSVCRLCDTKKAKVYQPEQPFPHAEVSHTHFFTIPISTTVGITIFRSIVYQEWQTQAFSQHPWLASKDIFFLCTSI